MGRVWNVGIMTIWERLFDGGLFLHSWAGLEGLPFYADLGQFLHGGRERISMS